MITKRSLIAVPAALSAALVLASCSSSPEAEDAPAQEEATQAVEGEELRGVWEMTSLEQETDGDSEEVPHSGQIVFGPETVSVQAMNPDTEAPDTDYTVEGYEAFYGDLSIDAEAGTWSVDVESAAARDLIGQTLERNYEVTDDTLVLTPIDAAEGWQVTYERVS